MELILIAGIALTGIGILVGLYLPILAAQFVVPEKIRVAAIAGAMLVVMRQYLRTPVLGEEICIFFAGRNVSFGQLRTCHRVRSGRLRPSARFLAPTSKAVGRSSPLRISWICNV